MVVAGLSKDDSFIELIVKIGKFIDEVFVSKLNVQRRLLVNVILSSLALLEVVLESNCSWKSVLEFTDIETL